MVSRRRILKTGATGLSVGLAGCLHGGNAGDNEGNEDGTGEQDGEEETGLSVAVIYGLGGMDDASFNNAANRGAREAADEFDVGIENFEPETADGIGSLQEELALSEDPNYDLIVCVGVEHAEPLRENADEYTDQSWAIIDTSVDRPNVESWELAGEESAYLAGEAAAELSVTDFSAGGGETNPDEKKLGFVGGAEVPVVQEIEAGFRAGAESVDEEFEVLTSYVGGFDRPDEVRNEALSLTDEGADILLHGAGGTGVFEACQERGRFAFGGDSRQSETAPEFSDVILGSFLKGVDTGAFRAVERVANGGFEGGQTFELGAGDDGFGLAWGAEIGDQVPQDIRDGAEETEQAIADGEIQVPDTP